MNTFRTIVSIFFMSSVWLLLSCSHSVAQAYRIEVTVPSLKDTSCILGHFNYNDKQFIAKDTARADKNGKMVFSKPTSLPGGLYIVVLPGQKHLIQFVYSGNEPQFSMETDTTDIIASMKVTGSKENEVFYDYQNQIRDISVAMQKLEAKKKTPDANQEEIVAEATKLNQAFTAKRDELIAANASLFVGKLMKATVNKQLAVIPTKVNGQPDHDAAFNYYKNHFWENFDLTDDRMLRTPFLESKLEVYIKNLTAQVTDSLIKSADALIAKATNKAVKDYIIYYITNQYENPSTVGTEAMFIHMAEKYYLGGVIALSEEGKKRIRERVMVLKPLLVSKVLPDFAVIDPQKKPIRLHQIQAEYTVIAFYSPTCGHCKESAPKLKEAYNAFKDKGVKIIAIAIDQEKEWGKFIKDYQLEELINGYDLAHQIDYRNKYDVMSTPMTYVLDKQKRIVARKMPVEQLSDFLNFTLSKNKSK